MLFNLYLIFSEDAASDLLIKAEIAVVVLINLGQVRLSGRSVVRSNLINFLASTD